MVIANIQRIYDEHVAALPAGERLRLVELITRGLAVPDEVAASEIPDVPLAILRESSGWQPTDRRESRTEWRDRAL